MQPRVVVVWAKARCVAAGEATDKPSSGMAEAELLLLLEEEFRSMPPARTESATGPVGGSPSRSTLARLRELEQMRKEGLINESEFKAKRQKLIEEQ